jgi:hypothetical protein
MHCLKHLVKPRNGFIVLLLWGCFHSLPAAAFFPDFQEAAQQVDAQLGGLHSLQLEISFPDEPRLKLLLWIKGTAWRQEWVQQHADGSQGLAAAAVGRGNRSTARYHAQQGFPLPVLFFWYRRPVQAFWEQQEIDPAHRAYRFLNTTPCLVFGVERHVNDLPQVWLHAEHWVPLRLQSGQGPVWTWLEYRRIGNIPLPHRARVEAADGTQVELMLAWRGVNRDIAETLFDPAAFRDRFSNAPPPGCELDLCARLFRILPHGE